MGQAGSSFFWPGKDPEAPGAGKTLERARQQFVRNVDKSGFNWLVFVVAASGFFTDSYNLFASNVILPALDHVYWVDEEHDAALHFNLATLVASAFGQLVFGYFADRCGRKSLYGIELIIVITSTIGLLQCSNGISATENGRTDHTWDINGWIFFWRIIMGIGIGAEYPLSACIAAEWSSTEARGRMLAAVFFMQPLGQLCAYGAGLTTLKIFGDTEVDIDRQWRYVVGIGTLPTLLALGFRIFMPESGRYTYDVLRTIPQHLVETNGTPMGNLNSSSRMHNLDDEVEVADQITFIKIWHFLFHEGYWTDLFGTSMCWALLDFAFYGLGFSAPSTLQKLWSDSPTDITISGRSIKGDLSENMTRGLYTFSLAAILGSIAIILAIDWVNRKKMLTFTFCVLAAVLAAAAGSFKALFHKEGLHIILIMFWNLISFLFSFGPNILTFIIPAEVFPTKFRCTLYGIAAAFGKLGAVLVQIVILKTASFRDPDSPAIRWLLLSFAVCMVLGALCSHFFVPEVQRRSMTEDTRAGCLCGVRKVPLYANIPLQDLPRPKPPRKERTRPAVNGDGGLNGVSV